MCVYYNSRRFTLSGQLTTLLWPLRPTGGTVSERCCISVVVQRCGRMPDGWVMMRLMQVWECNETHDILSLFSYSYVASIFFFYTTAASSSSCTKYLVLQSAAVYSMYTTSSACGDPAHCSMIWLGWIMVMLLHQVCLCNDNIDIAILS